MSRTYLLALGSQMPDRSGWPSLPLGAGAEKVHFALRGKIPPLCGERGGEKYRDRKVKTNWRVHGPPHEAQ